LIEGYERLGGADTHVDRRVAEVALPVRECPAAPTENEARDDEQHAEDDRR
jgi:hypothetical protein